MKSTLSGALFFFLTQFAHGQTVELLCRNFNFGMSLGGVISQNGFSVMTQNTTVTTTSGTVMNAQLAFQIIVNQQFQAINRAAGQKGELLAAGQCGLAKQAISGINLDVYSGKPAIRFTNFRYMSVSSGGMLAGSTKSLGTVSLPACPSGVTIFTAIVESPNSYFVAGDTNVRCL